MALIITDFIRNTKRELYDEKLEDVLEMLDLEWSKDNDTKTQCNRLNTSPLHRGNARGNASNKNGPARVKRWMQWEAPSKLLAVDDLLLLPKREVHAEIGINWFMNRKIPKRGYVRNKLVFRSRDTERRVCQNPSRVATLGRTQWQNKNKNYRGPHYMHGAAQRVDNCEQQLEFLTKAMFRPRTRPDHGHPRGN